MGEAVEGWDGGGGVGGWVLREWVYEGCGGGGGGGCGAAAKGLGGRGVERLVEVYLDVGIVMSFRCARMHVKSPGYQLLVTWVSCPNHRVSSWCVYE